MVSKHVAESITEAKKILDEIGKGNVDPFEVCDAVDATLMNIKGFIHNETVWQKVQNHEDKVHKEFNRRYIKITNELKNKQPWDQWREAGKQEAKLRHWKSLEMLNFYDKISKEHDI